MKKSMTGNRKFKWRRFAAAAGAGLSAAVMLITAVLGSSIDAQAADTLIGIEKLRSRVKESGSNYVVLEIVPDKSAAEIGYLFDDYEPILGEWDEETKEWKSWRDVLCTIETPEKRAEFINEKKEALRAYYEKAGLTSDFPVEAVNEAYEESNEPASGFEKITSAEYQKTGWFLVADETASSKYQVVFRYAEKYSKDRELDTERYLFYEVADATEITESTDTSNIADDTLIYIKIKDEKDVYQYVGTWEEVGETVKSYALNHANSGGEEDGKPGDEETGEPQNPDDGSENQTDEPGDSGDETPDEPDTTEPSDGEGDNPTDPSKGESETPTDPGDGEAEDSNEPENPSVSLNIQQRKWFQLVNDTPEDSNNSGADEPTNNPGEPGTGGSQDPENPGTGETQDPEEPGADDTENSGEPDEGEPTNPDDEVLDDSISDNKNPLATSQPDDEGYYFVKFRKLESYANIEEGKALYIVDESSIKPHINGEYTFVEWDEEQDGTSTTRQVYTFAGRTIYCKNTFKSNEWFKKHVVNLDKGDYKDFHVKVLTLTPGELEAMDKLPKFDFLYLNSGLRSATASDDGSLSGNDVPEQGDDGKGDQITFTSYMKDTNDLSDTTLKELFDAAVAGARPCLVDGSILYARGEGNAEGASDGTVVNEDLKNTNIFKLSAMFCQKNLSEWYENRGGNYAGVSADTLMKGIVEDADKNFVSEHVYCRFGDDSIINDLFYTPTLYKEDKDNKEVNEVSEGFRSVLDEINLENMYREADSSGNYKQLPTDISQATAVRHILNYANRRTVETKEHIRVLEIQPAKVDEWTAKNGKKYTSELTLEQLQKWAPGVKSAEITVMTTAEFIGNIEKLNENYDLIYIGTSKDHLNMWYWYPAANKNYTGKPDENHIPAGTAFNDTEMDGLIYYNIGDLRGVSMQLAGQLDSEYTSNPRGNGVYYYNYTRYGGNDITEEKMKALLSFLDGSYPVIVADDFFEKPVTVYASPQYQGGRMNMSEGEYTYDKLHEMGIATGDISSVKVKEGYEITLYNSYDLSLEENRLYSVSFKEDCSDFNQVKMDSSRNWNNQPNSLKVELLPDATPTRTIDGDHIDNCTYMYEFVEKAMEKKYVNFYAWSDITDDSEIFKFYLNRPKISLSEPTVNGRKKENSDIYYIESGINGRYNLQYSFTIRNEGAASYNTRYICKLYIDINSDGKYSAAEEVADINITQGGGHVSPEELYADRPYLLQREVPAGYKGLLPWRVEITQADNENIYTSMSGYTKLEDVEQEKITVLQLTRDRANWEPKHNKDEMFNLGKEIETPGTIYNVLVHGGTYGDEEYEGIEDDYDIDVTFKTISEYQDEFWENNDYLDDFNMLILGFDDMYADIQGNDKSGPMGAIVDFINSGKSVLLSHDTTSYSQFTWGTSGYLRDGTDVTSYVDDVGQSQTRYPDNPFAYSMNLYIRPLVGMDRYGILTSGILKAGNPLSQDSEKFTEVVSSRHDKAYKPKSGKTQLVPQVHGYTYVVVSGKDYSHTGGVDKKTFSRRELDLSQAENWTFTNKYRNIRYDDVYYRVRYEIDGSQHSDWGELSDSNNTYGEINHLWVTKTNQGQITEYPYHLPETFEIAETHGQYYQLDYTEDADGDGESDLVVWFCLDRRGENGEQETVYSQSPNDVRNNYYIYNKGNITYTGVGHSMSGISHDRNPDYTLNEAKLFINTIIAAYQAGIKNPYISVLKRGVPESEEMKLMYRFYDNRTDAVSLDDAAATEDYEKIYFTVQDVNFIKGTRTIATHVYYKKGEEAGSVPITVGGEEITVNPVTPEEIYKAADDSLADADNLASGGIYYIKVPRWILQQCENGLDLYFEAQTTLTTSTTNVNVYETDKVYAKLQVLQAYMFNLE